METNAIVILVSGSDTAINGLIDEINVTIGRRITPYFSAELYHLKEKEVAQSLLIKPLSDHMNAERSKQETEKNAAILIGNAFKDLLLKDKKDSITFAEKLGKQIKKDESVRKSVEILISPDVVITPEIVNITGITPVIQKIMRSVYNIATVDL